jgi:hypothetical protein
MLLLGVVLVLVGCTRAYTIDQLRKGVEVTVDDPEGLVANAWLFPLDAFPDARAVGAEIDRSSTGSVVLDPDDGFDVVVAYRAGPYCGLLPAVSTFSDDADFIVVEVESRRGGDCTDLLYDEAIGIDFTDAREGRPVVVDRHR